MDFRKPGFLQDFWLISGGFLQDLLGCSAGLHLGQENQFSETALVATALPNILDLCWKMLVVVVVVVVAVAVVVIVAVVIVVVYSLLLL